MMAKKTEDKTPNGRPIYDYTEYGREPFTWYYQADNMRKASEALFGRVQEEFNADPPVSYRNRTEPIYRYLVGMAIERLLKGIMVYNDPDLVHYGKISEKLDGHNMWTKHTGKSCKKVRGRCRLSEIESELTKEEQEFVRDLEPYVDWMGRYGIAKKRGTYETNSRTVDSKPDAEEFRKKFTTIYTKIHLLLDKKIVDRYVKRKEKKQGELDIA